MLIYIHFESSIRSFSASIVSAKYLIQASDELLEGFELHSEDNANFLEDSNPMSGVQSFEKLIRCLYEVFCRDDRS